MTTISVWNGHLEQWKAGAVRPPFVPTAEDLSLLRQACPDALFEADMARVLILGVTPALVMAPWPQGFEIFAVDFDRAMIEALWSEAAAARAQVICANWADMPFPDDYFDLVVGDGSFCALPSLDAYPDVLAEIVRVKRNAAPIIARFFAQSDQPFSLLDLVHPDKGVATLDYTPSELRLLLLMALCQPDAKVDHRQLRQAITDNWGDPDAFVAAGWPQHEEAAKTHLMLASQQVLNFPTLAQVEVQFAPFRLKPTVLQPEYRVGAFCPTICFDGDGEA